MEAFETFEHAGFTVELHQDWDDPTKPSDWDQAGELVAFAPLWREFRFAERETDGQEDEALERGGLPLLARYLRTARGQTILPFAYHDYGSSGPTLNEVGLGSDRAAGFIVTDAERLEKVGATDAEACLRSELSDWAAYVAGEIVGYVIRDDRGEVVGSCWGFYPDETGDGLDYVREEARNEAEGLRDARIARAEARQLGWALARVARPRLEYLRGELRAERISYGELAELQGMAAYIELGDVELLEAAGVPEVPDDSEGSRSTAGIVNGADGGEA